MIFKLLIYCHGTILNLFGVQREVYDFEAIKRDWDAAQEEIDNGMILDIHDKGYKEQLLKEVEVKFK